MICWTSQQYIEPTSILVTESSAKLPKYITLTTISKKKPNVHLHHKRPIQKGEKFLKRAFRKIIDFLLKEHLVSKLFLVFVKNSPKYPQVMSDAVFF